MFAMISYNEVFPYYFSKSVSMDREEWPSQKMKVKFHVPGLQRRAIDLNGLRAELAGSGMKQKIQGDNIVVSGYPPGNLDEHDILAIVRRYVDDAEIVATF